MLTFVTVNMSITLDLNKGGGFSLNNVVSEALALPIVVITCNSGSIGKCHYCQTSYYNDPAEGPSYRSSCVTTGYTSDYCSSGCSGSMTN